MNRRIALAGLAALGLAAPAAGAGQRPILRPTGLQPLELRGTHFQAGESVFVLVLGGAGRASSRVKAAADGTWTISFPKLDAKGRSISVRAHGNRGSAALWWPRTLRPTVTIAPPTTR
jgi:hypothetical protein